MTPLSGAWQGDDLAYELGVGVGWETKINTLSGENSCARSIAVAKFHREGLREVATYIRGIIGKLGPQGGLCSITQLSWADTGGKHLLPVLRALEKTSQ